MINVIAKFNRALSLYGIDPGDVEAIVEAMKPAYLNYFDFASGSSTTIATAGTWVKLNTTTTQGFSRNGLTHTNNRVTNTGTSKVFRLHGIASLASGNNNEIHVAFFKNGEIIPCSEQDIVTSAAGKMNAVPFGCLTQLNTNDYVEVWVKNTTGTTAITLDNVNVEVIER
jgi:hypothetical protein